MKKLVYITVFLALAICTSCRDRSYQGLDPTIPDEEIELEQVPILMAVGDPSYSILTRGTGAFDKTTEGEPDVLRNAAVFYVYAFAKNDNVNFTRRANDTEHNPDKDICLVDGTLNKTAVEYDHGKSAVFNQDDYAFLNWADGAAYYNTVHQTLPYNFYAYYVDSMIINKQMPGAVDRGEDHISFPVKIDGRMDLLSSVALVTPAQQDSIIDKITDKKERKAMDECRYSAYTAHRGLSPYFTFKHHMAKMHFNLYAGDYLTIKRVFLDSIRINVNTEGIFTVVHKDTSKIGISKWDNPQWIQLKEQDGTNLKQNYYQAIWDEKDKDQEVYARTPRPVGDCFLVPPSDSINVAIFFHQFISDDPEVEPRTFKTEQTLKPSNGFEKGKAYNVRIAVFGELEIKISATIENWIPGGNIDVNPDANFQPD